MHPKSHQIAFVKRLLLFCITFIVHSADADFSRSASYDPGIEPDRFRQRQLYQDALHLIRSSQFTRYYKLKPQLRSYALYPYLEHAEKAYRISRQSEEDILAFVEQYQDTPLPERLLRHWLSNLARRGQWDTFLNHYQRVEPTKKLACLHGYALYNDGQRESAMARAQELWTVGFSQPDACDPIFNTWRGNGGVTPEIAWQRLALSLKENEKTLSGYLLRFIGRQDKPFANNYRLVHIKPNIIKRFATFKQPDPRNREIILHGVRRLARLDPVAAVTVLQRYESMHSFDPLKLEDAYADIGIQLALSSDDLALAESLPVTLYKYPGLIEARLRQSLKHGEWSNLLTLINLLPANLEESARWQYWKARTLARSDDVGDRDVAREIFTELASNRSFYGFISADILQQGYNFQDEGRRVNHDRVLSLEEAPGIRRALELFSLKERAQARREWYFTTADFTQAKQEVAAQVALRWGWYEVAIKSMIDAGAWNHLDFRFPFAYRDSFITHARHANIPVQWSLAVARQESAFMPDSRSGSGALGVMQLLPGTAKLVAKKLGINYGSNTRLTEPDLNIKLGTHYLEQMLRRFQGNRILASAAYNAGPGHVARWVDPGLPFDVWIEVIPFKETRNYVQNVLMFSSVYSHRMNEEQPLVYPHERDDFLQQQMTGIPLTSADDLKPANYDTPDD